jgi:hypothetical protein
MKPKCRHYFGDVNAPVGVWLLVGTGLAGPEGSDAGYIYASTPPPPLVHPPTELTQNDFIHREKDWFTPTKRIPVPRFMDGRDKGQSSENDPPYYHRDQGENKLSE